MPNEAKRTYEKNVRTIYIFNHVDIQIFLCAFVIRIKKSFLRRIFQIFHVLEQLQHYHGFAVHDRPDDPHRRVHHRRQYHGYFSCQEINHSFSVTDIRELNY